MAWINTDVTTYHKLRQQILLAGGEYADVSGIHGRVGELINYKGKPCLKRVDYYVQAVYYKNDEICGE